jgi:hypothetical protein
MKEFPDLEDNARAMWERQNADSESKIARGPTRAELAMIVWHSFRLPHENSSSAE